MNWPSSLLLLLLCGCVSGIPQRDFFPRLWRNDHNTESIYNMSSEGDIRTLSCSDEKFSGYISISPDDYAKERIYQDDLIRSCLEWR